MLISCLSKGRYPLWLDRQIKEMPMEMLMELGLMHPPVSGLMRSTNLSSFVIGGTANWNESRSKVCSTLPFHSFLLVTFITPLLLFIWFFIMANFKQQAMYRQCVAYLVQGLWQLQTQLPSSQLRMAKSIESLKQVMPFSTFSLRFSPPLPLSVHLHSPHTSLIHSSYLSGEASVLRQHGEGEETKECQFNNCLNGLVLDEATNTCFVVAWGDHHVIKKITF